jgi:phage shock protein C
MPVPQPLPAPQENMFGVCASLGRDIGFNPLYLRIVLAFSLLWNPVAILVGYAVTGVVVAFTHWLAPDPRRAAKHGELAAS